MKYSIFYSFLILLSISLFCSRTYAQEDSRLLHFTFFGGAAFPLSDFSSTTANNAGFANTGYCVMIEADKNISKDVYWASSISFAVNGLNKNSLQSSMGTSLAILIGNNMGFVSNVWADNYTTTWIMTGFGFEMPVSSAIKIYSVEQIGLLISTFSDISFSNYNTSGTLTTKAGTAFAAELGAGAIIDNINIGLRYYAGEPYHRQTLTFSGSTEDIREEFPVTIVQFIIGYNF
jgi:hypothetical protein